VDAFFTKQKLFLAVHVYKYRNFAKELTLTLIEVNEGGDLGVFQFFSAGFYLSVY
tara:strand:- start:1646 stop:1810 length:165 start_codon:yes stop_codon:yes gene_type:complete